MAMLAGPYMHSTGETFVQGTGRFAALTASSSQRSYNRNFNRRELLSMPIQPTAKIWHNGNLVPWDKAQIHVMSHVVHFMARPFLKAFAAMRQPQGAAIFRPARTHAATARFSQDLSHATALFAGAALERSGRLRLESKRCRTLLHPAHRAARALRRNGRL